MGQTSSSANSANASSASAVSARIPVRESPGKAAPRRSMDAWIRAKTPAAADPSSCFSRLRPYRSRAASAWEMRKTPVQHWLHPGLHTNQSPERRAASASAASTIWTSSASSVDSTVILRATAASPAVRLILFQRWPARSPACARHQRPAQCALKRAGT